MNEPFYWVNERTEKFLDRGYLSPGETAQSRVRDIADKAESILGIPGFSDKFYDYMGKGWYSLSSPVWSNYGKSRGLGVSCFGSDVSDSVPGILRAGSEIGAMSKAGGGTAVSMGKVRPRGSAINNNGTSTGAVHFLELFQAITDVISQGSTRRGRTAAYLPIDHGDIEEFLKIGTEGNPIQSMNTAVTISDQWMNDMLEGNTSYRKVWGNMLKQRSEVGYPYILFTDNVNNKTVDVYKDKGMRINHSQLCSEILLPTTSEESFVCVLSSMNLLHYDEWKDTDAVETLVYFLDSVVSEFITDLETFRDSDDPDDKETFHLLKRAYTFAVKHRALGVGSLGWHSLLQSKMLPFEGRDAAKLNLEIAKVIKDKSYKASKELATLLGEPSVLKGYGRRNTTLNAIAPTTSSAFILGQVSQSIEPYFSNYYIKDLAKAKVVVKNKYLEALLDSKGLNDKSVWDVIAASDGSVYGLSDDILTPEEKAVFKTFREIDQNAIIAQASTRGEYIDQGQSLNLMITSDLSPKEISELHITAWRQGIKTLYYQHSVNQSQQFAMNKNQSCEACEG